MGNGQSQGALLLVAGRLRDAVLALIDKLYKLHPQGPREPIEYDDRRISPTLFDPAEILLAERAALGDLFLRQAA